MPCDHPVLKMRGDAARSDRRSSSGSRSVRDHSRVHCAGRLGSSFAFLAPSDDRRVHGCGPEIPADSSARVQTPASALVHGSCWMCRASLAASRCVSAFAVSFRTPTRGRRKQERAFVVGDDASDEDDLFALCSLETPTTILMLATTRRSMHGEMVHIFPLEAHRTYSNLRRLKTPIGTRAAPARKII